MIILLFSKTAPLPKLSTITTKQMSNNIRPTSINISTTKHQQLLVLPINQ